MTWSMFSFVSGPSVCPLSKSVYLGLLPIFDWIVCLSFVKLCEFPINFGDETLIGDNIGKYVLPCSGLSCCFVDGFFCCAELFILM